MVLAHWDTMRQWSMNTSLRHIILTPSRPVLVVPINAERQAGTNKYHILTSFGMTQSGIEPATFRSPGERSNHYTTQAVLTEMKTHRDNFNSIIQDTWSFDYRFRFIHHFNQLGHRKMRMIKWRLFLSVKCQTYDYSLHHQLKVREFGILATFTQTLLEMQTKKVQN